MTPAQQTTFKTAINAEANVAAALAAGDHGAITAYYNGAGTGFVWRPAISVDEMKTAIDWAAFAALTALKQGAYSALTQGTFVDATSANVRGGFVAVFGAGSATVTALTALAQKVPTRYEGLFAVSNVTPVFGQTVTVADVVAALGS